MNLKYSIGLDIGVASVGWACMTDELRILKHNGRYAIGVREFEAAETAGGRRVHRGTRRRYNRRLKRIQLLQQTMSPLFEDDPSFFIETDEKEKHFWKNSNQFENHTLSETLSFLGKNKRTYPTIYHLRTALLQEDRKFHPRLIYLALHHLVKFRGHFLNENMNWNRGEGESIQQLIKEYLLELTKYSYEASISDEDITKLAEILENDGLTDSDKRTNMLKILGKDFQQPITLIVGLKVDIAKLFHESDNYETYKEENLKIAFSDEDITETYEKLTDEEQMIIDLGNVIYQNVLLKDLLGEATCVAEAKVNAYEQFKEDLKLLKDIYNKYFGEKDYRKMFITSRKDKNQYSATHDSKYLCTFDKFLKFKKEEDAFYREIKNKFDVLRKDASISNKDMATIKDVLNRINREQFLQKQKNKINASIPHQNNVYEAEKILRNQQNYYSEITDEMIEKIIQIISFRIPYYIGPLVKNNENAPFGWLVRNNNHPITPWDIYDEVNRSESAEKFINKMTNYCAYLLDEKVLPKNSLLYEKFEMLNELNGIQIRPPYETSNRKFRLGKDEKDWIINNVFSKYKTVTHQILKRELKNSPYKHIILDENSGEIKEIYGTQKEDRFSTNLSTFIDMKKIFAEVNEQTYPMLERFIYWITVFDEKEIIEMKIRENYPQITDKQIEQLIHLNYSGWGRLSEKLLDEIPANPGSQETIIEVMEKEPLVFMEVLAVEAYDLNERIAKINQKDEEKYTKIKYADIAELQGSPAIKKGIWQAILIVEELTSIFGEPENIMIEFARHDDRKERTKSRKKQIDELYKAISKEEKELKDFLSKHSRYEEADYRNNRLYLYITQNGKCLYSGEALNISRLQDYEVDHILPRSFVKDDSLDNLALVKQGLNQLKGHDKMPLEIMDEKTKRQQKDFWKQLYKNKMISQKKYFRLMKETFSDQDKESFLARQLVETRQIIKHVKDLLEERFQHTEIHPVNANIISKLREHSNIYKIRDLNNKHHAIDAALAVLIIQFMIKKYGNNILKFNFKYQEARKKWREMITTYGKNFFLFTDVDQYDKFVHYKTGELLKGREFLQSLNYEIPWQTTKKVGSNEGAFYNQTIYSPKSVKGRKPQYQSSKLAKGVHSNLNVDSSYLISYKFIDKRNKEKTASEIVNYNVIEKYQTKGYSNTKLALFLAEKVAKGKVVDAKIHTRILKNQLVLVDGHPLYFVSEKELNNAKHFNLKRETIEKLYLILNGNSVDNVDNLKSLFIEIADEAVRQYQDYLPPSRIDIIQNYSDEIVDRKTFKNGVEELFKMANAGPGRSDKLFGGRYERKLDPKKAKFVYQSVT